VFLLTECDGMYLLVWQQLNMHLGYSDRLSIYHSLVEEISHLKLSGQIEIDDEALFGGRRRGGKKRGWGSIEHKNLVFGIYYKRNGIVITFPMSDRQNIKH
jgi:hypothetical protein